MIAITKNDVTLSEKKCPPAAIRARLTKQPYVTAIANALLRFLIKRANASVKKAAEPCPDEK